MQLSDTWQSRGLDTDKFVRHVAVLWSYHGYSCQAFGSPAALPQMQLTGSGCPAALPQIQLSGIWQSCGPATDTVVRHLAVLRPCYRCSCQAFGSPAALPQMQLSGSGSPMAFRFTNILSDLLLLVQKSAFEDRNATPLIFICISIMFKTNIIGPYMEA